MKTRGFINKLGLNEECMTEKIVNIYIFKTFKNGGPTVYIYIYVRGVYGHRRACVRRGKFQSLGKLSEFFSRIPASDLAMVLKTWLWLLIRPWLWLQRVVRDCFAVGSL